MQGEIVSRWQRWITGIQEEAKALVFFTVLLTIFRIVFLIIFQSQLANASIADIGMSLWLGFRLSLKTVGFISLVGLVIATIPRVWTIRWPAQTIRTIWYSIVTVIFTLLFFGRIPFYRIFNSSYNAMLINGKNDDISAIINTAINEYHAIPFLIVALMTSSLLCWLLVKLLHTNTFDWYPKTINTQIGTAIASVLGIVVFFVLFRFGGAFSYTHSINWESAARLNSNVLNETILDDVQALYRVRTIAKRIHALETVQLSTDELKRAIAHVGGNPHSKTFDEAFTKTITTQRLETEPQSIHIILGESYGLWPFLPEFNKLGTYIVEQGRSIEQKPNAMHTQYALAQGTGTMPAINGLLTGMPDVGLYPNYEQVSYEAPYGLGIAPVMKQLGYKTVFWYGGFSTWQNVKDFALSQGFDEFHDASEISSTAVNAWGVDDGDLFKAISAYMAAHRDEKIVNVIMTTSNHPPYSIDVEKEGFNTSYVMSNLPHSIANTEQQIKELGHIWYADHVMGEFVRREEQQDPSALFVITGDHSERFTFASEEGPQVTSTIPLIFYGKGIQQEWLGQAAFGMSIQMIPTLAELVGRPGQTYASMVPSLFDSYPFVFNHRLWMDSTGIHGEHQPMPGEYRETMDTLRTLAAWRMKHGNVIE